MSRRENPTPAWGRQTAPPLTVGGTVNWASCAQGPFFLNTSPLANLWRIHGPRTGRGNNIQLVCPVRPVDSLRLGKPAHPQVGLQVQSVLQAKLEADTFVQPANAIGRKKKRFPAPALEQPVH